MVYVAHRPIKTGGGAECNDDDDEEGCGGGMFQVTIGCSRGPGCFWGTSKKMTWYRHIICATVRDTFTCFFFSLFSISCRRVFSCFRPRYFYDRGDRLVELFYCVSFGVETHENVHCTCLCGRVEIKVRDFRALCHCIGRFTFVVTMWVPSETLSFW